MTPKVSNSAEPFLPEKINFRSLRKAVQSCRGCDLYKNATQAVFGEGPAKASVFLVGEKPGDKEDIAGHPFVGPAGNMLEKLLREAGIPRDEVYVTNAVKHFKFERHGKRRLHQKPSATEIKACQPWLQAELSLVQPHIIVCLGATAAKSIFRKTVTLKSLRGEFHETEFSHLTYVTNHPSALLRMPSAEKRKQAYKQTLADFRLIRKALNEVERHLQSSSSAISSLPKQQIQKY